eukprot:2734843-Amphidinium_carterae.1
MGHAMLQCASLCCRFGCSVGECRAVRFLFAQQQRLTPESSLARWSVSSVFALFRAVISTGFAHSVMPVPPIAF